MGWGWDYVKGLASRAGHLGGEMVRGAENVWTSTVEGFDKAGNRLEDHPGMAATVRPQGINGRDIYLMFHGPEAKGTGSIDSSVAGWRKVSDCHEEAGDALASAMTKLGIAWGGATAESASASVVPLREAADTASRQALHAGNVLETQSSCWNDTAHKVTEVPADPPRLSIVQVDPVTPVLSRNEATAYAAGQQVNQRALSCYGTMTSTNTQQVPQFAVPAVPSAARGVGGQQSGSVGHGGQGVGSVAGSSETIHSGQSTVDSAGSHAGSTVDDGRQPAATHSSWQVADLMHRPDGAQATPQEQAMPVAGVAAGAAGLIAGGSALAGSTGAVGGSSIGARLAGGGSLSGIGGSSAKSGSPDSGGRNATGEEPEAATGSRGVGASGGSSAAGSRRRKEEDQGHNSDYLVEANPHELFGHDRQVAPPVFGEDAGPIEGSAEDA